MQEGNIRAAFQLWLILIILTIIIIFMTFITEDTSNQYGFLKSSDGYYEPVPNDNAMVFLVEEDLESDIKIIRDTQTYDHFVKKAKSADSSKDERIIVTRFHASWCGPCRASEALWHKLAKKYRNKVVFIDVDIDIFKGLMRNQKVKGVPTWIVTLKGKEVGRQVGFDNSLNKVEEFMHKAHNMDIKE